MKMSIRTRLGLGFAAMLVLVIVTAVVGIASLDRIGESMATVMKQADQSAALYSIHAGVLTFESTLLTVLENPSAASLSNAKVMLESLNDEITDYEHPMSPEDVSMLEEKRVAFIDAAEEYLAQAEVQAVYMPSARDYMGTKADELLLATDTMAQEQLRSLADVHTAASRTESATRTLMFASAIAAAILGVLLAVTITRSITVPLANLVKVSDKISTGELDTPVPLAAKDEIGELAESMERMRISIKALVERMRSRSGG
jgi:methyl-accepting chemotaxis protein